MNLFKQILVNMLGKDTQKSLDNLKRKFEIRRSRFR